MNTINSVSKIQSICQKARIGAIVLFCFCIVGVIGFGYSLLAVLRAPAELVQNGDIVQKTSNAIAICQIIQKTMLFVIYGIALLICSNMFKGICDDQTPFRQRTVMALRNMSLLMVGSAVIPYFMGFLYYLAAVPKEGFSLRLAIAHSGLQVAAVPLFLAVFLFVMTAVFKYGCILQQESDETL